MNKQTGSSGRNTNKNRQFLGKYKQQTAVSGRKINNNKNAVSERNIFKKWEEYKQTKNSVSKSYTKKCSF